ADGIRDLHVTGVQTCALPIYLPESRAWLEQYLADTSSLRLLEQRVRRAVIEQDWDNVLHWVDRLPQKEQHSARWRYWRARALGEIGRASCRASGEGSGVARGL